MTDRQMQFIAWLITTATDKCQTLEEVREMNREIREHSTGWKRERTGRIRLIESAGDLKGRKQHYGT